VSEATAGGRRPAWALPRGVLSFVHVPGHAPGQVRPRALFGLRRFCLYVHRRRAGAATAPVRAAPPQIALLHEPSGTLLAADVVAYGKGLTGTSAAALTMAPGPATANMTQARRPRMRRARCGRLLRARRWGPGTQARLDAERLAALPFTRLFPSHDAGAGVTHSALADLLGSLPRAL